MQPQNLVINKATYYDDGNTMLDASPWFEPFESHGIDEVLSGRWYKNTVDSMVGENILSVLSFSTLIRLSLIQSNCN